MAAVTMHGCRECGRMISQREAEDTGMCMACSRRHAPAAPAAPPKPAGMQLRRMGEPALPPTPKATPERLIIPSHRDVLPAPQADLPETPLNDPPVIKLRRPEQPMPDDSEDQAPPAPSIRPMTPAQRPPRTMSPPPITRAAPSPEAGQRAASLRLKRDADTADLEGNWYVNFGKKGRFSSSEKIEGPFTWNELCALVVSETLTPAMQVKRETSGQWVPAGSVDQIFGEENLRKRDDRLARAQQAKMREQVAKERKKMRDDSGGSTDRGMIAGLGMMIGAILWFVIGWAYGYIFFYPPILFILGLISFLRGAFNGRL